MDLNPYAQFLLGDDPLPVMQATAGEVEAIVGRLSPEQAEAPRAPGKWSAREIVAHLADCELVFGFRLRQTLSEGHPVIQPFDQTNWATRYAGYPLAPAMALFSALRAWNLLLLQGVRPEEWSRPVTHPERGVMTLRTIAETIAGHDRNHLVQLRELAARG